MAAIERLVEAVTRKNLKTAPDGALKWSRRLCVTARRIGFSSVGLRNKNDAQSMTSHTRRQLKHSLQQEAGSPFKRSDESIRLNWKKPALNRYNEPRAATPRRRQHVVCCFNLRLSMQRNLINPLRIIKNEEYIQFVIRSKAFKRSSQNKRGGNRPSGSYASSDNVLHFHNFANALTCPDALVRAD